MEELKSAQSLKAAGQARQAYHHPGQAVEFALKAIYIRRKGLQTLPDDCKGAKWHSLPHIAKQAGLDGDLAQLARRHKGRYSSWMTARDWDSNGRFPGNKLPARELNDLFVAVCHDQDGVMKWLESIFQKS